MYPKLMHRSECWEWLVSPLSLISRKISTIYISRGGRCSHCIAFGIRHRWISGNCRWIHWRQFKTFWGITFRKANYQHKKCTVQCRWTKWTERIEKRIEAWAFESERPLQTVRALPYNKYIWEEQRSKPKTKTKTTTYRQWGWSRGDKHG